MTKALKYLVVYNHYRGLIKSKALIDGERLPTEAEIEEQFKVSRITVVNALNRLQKDGYIKRIQGSGSFVTTSSEQITGNTLDLIALIIPFHGQGREIALIESIEKNISHSGYNLIIKNTNDDPETEAAIIKDLENKVSGFILYPTTRIINHELYHSLFLNRFPVVYIDRYPSSIPVAYIVSDNISGGYELGRYLLTNKHNHFILMFHDIQNLTSERDRFNGFMKAMAENGITKSQIEYFQLPISPDLDPITNVVLSHMQEQLKQNKKVAIFTCNDMMAYRLMSNIPIIEASGENTFTIAGFDDLEIAPVTQPFVTIRQNHGSIGTEASTLLLNMIKNNTVLVDHRIIPVKLVEKKRTI